MFERMTEPARLVVRDAQDIARECGHGSIEPPHWLLALLRTRDTEGYEALHQAGLSYDDVRSAVQPMYEQAARGTQLPFGADSRSLLELLVGEAGNAERIETAHVALACTHGDKLPSLARFVAGREGAIREVALSGLRSPDRQAGSKQDSAEERRDARERASTLRAQRARLRLAVKAGRVSVHVLLLEPPRCIGRTAVADFLLWLPGYGPARVDRLLEDCAILPATVLSLLSRRQRTALVERLDGPDDAPQLDVDSILFESFAGAQARSRRLRPERQRSHEEPQTMPDAAVRSDPRTIAESLIQRLQDAWNAGDGAAFGAPFAADADFVTIRGELHSGPAIAAGHQGIFDTIYAGSTVRYTLLDARELGDRVILAHVSGHLSVPAGPLAGEAMALASVVVVRDGDAHRIASFHNTLVAAR
jgi:uncharacterized protein (TIGR02246 family)